MPPLDPNDPDNLAKLAADDDLPDAEPDDVPNSGDHPQKDTNEEPSEVVDVGEDYSAGIDDPQRKRPHDYKPRNPDEEGFDRDPV